MKKNQFRYLGLLVILVLFVAVKLFYTGSRNSGKARQNETSHWNNDQRINSSDYDDNSAAELNRNATHITYSKHARCRMDCRHIDAGEIKEVLLHGVVNKRKIEEDSRGKTYPLEEEVQGHHLRVVFAPKGVDVVEVVTCIDLDTEWPCDCR